MHTICVLEGCTWCIDAVLKTICSVLLSLNEISDHTLGSSRLSESSKEDPWSMHSSTSSPPRHV